MLHKTHTSKLKLVTGNRDEPDSPARLAHELANLLDGSLRNVGLALAVLKKEAQHENDLAAEAPMRTSRERPSPTVGGKAEGGVFSRLETANDAMQQMAMLIRRWMSTQHRPDRLHAQTKTLGQTVEHAIRLLGPAANMRQIEITSRLESNVAQLPAGPIYPIIANALRNSIEALTQDMIDRPGRTHGHIDLHGELNNGQVILTITDNGPGFNPTLLDETGQFRFGITTKDSGYGLGLSLTR